MKTCGRIRSAKEQAALKSLISEKHQLAEVLVCVCVSVCALYNIHIKHMHQPLGEEGGNGGARGDRPPKAGAQVC